MQDFLKKTKCDRCGGSLHPHRQTSMFNLDCLCPSCIEKERKHPDYKKALEADREAIKNGNYNFEGIGLPEELKPLNGK